MSFAIIGGTGLSVFADLMEGARRESVETDFGSAEVVRGRQAGKELVFLPRHGLEHGTAPHLINYRANIKALQQLGVKNVFAGAAVGSINPEIKPGDFIILTQFIDFTKSRETSFFDGVSGKLDHVDMTEPYAPSLREMLKSAAVKKGVRLFEKATYVCTEGPRFETPAEIRAYGMLGADVVGMTGVPEVCLAREAGIAYATLAVSTNYAAGISKTPLTFEECIDVMKEADRLIFDIFIDAAQDGGLL